MDAFRLPDTQRQVRRCPAAQSINHSAPYNLRRDRRERNKEEMWTNLKKHFKLGKSCEKGKMEALHGSEGALFQQVADI